MLEEQSCCDTGDLLQACNLQLQATDLSLGLGWMEQIGLSVVPCYQSLVSSQTCRSFLKSVGKSSRFNFHFYSFPVKLLRGWGEKSLYKFSTPNLCYMDLVNLVLL